MRNNTFVISIQDLALEVIIGILPKERKTPQRILINAEISYKYKVQKILAKPHSTQDVVRESSQSARLDASMAYLDYVAIRDFLATHLQDARYGLLEEALEHTIASLKKHFPSIYSVWLCIKKPDIVQDCIVGMSAKRIFKE